MILHIENCPFCGSENVKPYEHITEPTDSYCQCADCGTIGPSGKEPSKESAIAAWNLRAALQAQQGEAKDARQAESIDLAQRNAELVLVLQQAENYIGTYGVEDDGETLTRQALPVLRQVQAAIRSQKAQRPTAAPAIDQDAKDAPAPATLSDEQIIKIAQESRPSIEIDNWTVAFARAILAAAGSSQGQDGALAQVMAEEYEGGTTFNGPENLSGEIHLHYQSPSAAEAAFEAITAAIDAALAAKGSTQTNERKT